MHLWPFSCQPLHIITVIYVCLGGGRGRRGFIAVSPEHSTLSMKAGIIQNKWIIRESSINESIKLLSSQPASGGPRD